METSSPDRRRTNRSPRATQRSDGRTTTRVRGLLVSLGAAVVAVSGAYASVQGVELGLAQPKRAADPGLAARARKLDVYARSLRSSLEKKPPALPVVPRYPTVTIPSVPALSTLVRSHEVSTAKPVPEATRAESAKRPVKIEYVRPAPVVKVVQPTSPTQIVPRGGGDDVGEDEGHEESGGDD